MKRSTTSSRSIRTGAALGGAVIAAGLGYVAPTWLGLVLCVPGVLFALAGWAR